MIQKLFLILLCLAHGCVSGPLEFFPGITDALYMYAGGTPEAKAYSHFLAGVVAEKQGDLDVAASEFNEAAALMPDEVTLQLRVVQVSIRLHDLEGAHLAARRAVKQVPDSPGLWTVLGWICQKMERHDEALDAFRHAVEIHPSSPAGYEALIRAAEQANDLVAIVDVYESLVAICPASALLHLRWGYNLARAGDHENACAAFQRAIELDPHLHQARYLLGLTCLEMDQDIEAVRSLEEYRASCPEDLVAARQLSGAYARLGLYSKAIELSQQVIARQPHDAVSHLAHVYLLLRTEQDARAVASQPREAPLLGGIMMAIARQSAGVAYTRPLERLDQTESDVAAEAQGPLLNLLFLYGEEPLGEFLIQAMSSFVEDGTPSRSLRLLLAHVYMALQRDEQAEEVLLSILADHDSDETTHHALATVYERMDRVEDAIKHLEACLKLDPADPDIMNFLGYLYAENDMRLHQAQRLIERALELQPDNPYYLDSLGWVHYRKGHATRAIQLIRRAVHLMDSDDAILRDHLGDAFLLDGNIESAVIEWERANRLDPDLEGVHEKLECYGAD